MDWSLKIRNLYRHLSWGILEYYSSEEECIKAWGTEKKDIELVKTYTEEEFILLDVPVEFHSILLQMAYSRGHSAGQDECLSILKELVFDLTPAIKEFKKRIMRDF